MADISWSWRLGAGAAAVLVALGVAGCGGSSERLDEGVVVVSEPSAVPATAGSGSVPTAGAGESGSVEKASAKEAAASPPAVAEGAVEGWGTLKGRVVFGGDAPAAKVLIEKGKAPKDAEICSKEPIMAEQLEVNPANKGVKNVIVYIPRPTRVNPDAEKAALESKVVFDQKSCVFVPHVIAVFKGSTITVLNSDSVGHNVNIRLSSNGSNFAVQPSASVQQTLKLPETRPGDVVCDIHPWMKAWWLVSPSPYFAVTDADGNYEIKNVPAGEQKVVVWAECLGGRATVTAGAGDSVAIRPGGEATAKEFSIDPAKVKLQ
jgi:plastocyanin